MADIFHDFFINASAEKIFDAITTPAGLDAWWTKNSFGMPEVGNEYKLYFGPDYDWRAKVTKSSDGSEFELRMTKTDKDWDGTKVGFKIEEKENYTQVHFYHTGWPETNEHFAVSSFCWAMYLRLLKKYVESGEIVDYDKRLEA